jgi:hypothetical protein
MFVPALKYCAKIKNQEFDSEYTLNHMIYPEVSPEGFLVLDLNMSPMQSSFIISNRPVRTVEEEKYFLNHLSLDKAPP